MAKSKATREDRIIVYTCGGCIRGYTLAEHDRLDTILLKDHENHDIPFWICERCGSISFLIQPIRNGTPHKNNSPP